MSASALANSTGTACLMNGSTGRMSGLQAGDDKCKCCPPPCPSTDSYAVAFHIEIIVYASTDGSCSGGVVSDNSADVSTVVYRNSTPNFQCGYNDLYTVDPSPTWLMKTYPGLGSYLGVFLYRLPNLAWNIVLDHSGVPDGYGNADSFGGGSSGPSPLPTSGAWSNSTDCSPAGGGWIFTDFKVIVTGVTVT